MSSNSLKMDVENPLVLKRSSSAPMINELNNIMASQNNSSTTRETVAMSIFSSSGSARPRRFSTSFSPLSGPSSPKLTPRVNQLRQEESVDMLGREAAIEKELNSAMVMSQSYEDLTLINDSKSDTEVRLRMMDPIHVNLPVCPTLPSSPSPNRSPLPFKQCFSPSFLKSGLSPSPTRKFTTRRSQSPIAMRPSSLGPVKRKCEMEDSEQPAKKVGLHIAQPKLEMPWSPSYEPPTSVETTPSPASCTPTEPSPQ